MNKLTSIILFMLCATQVLHVQANNDTIPEKFDFEPFNTERYGIKKQKNGQFIFIRKLEYQEYPLEKSCYFVQKLFYPNGNLKSKGRLIRNRIKIGVWQYYNEDESISSEKPDNE